MNLNSETTLLTTTPCDKCQGSGIFNGIGCAFCSGTGKKTVTVKELEEYLFSMIFPKVEYHVKQKLGR